MSVPRDQARPRSHMPAECSHEDTHLASIMYAEHTERVGAPGSYPVLVPWPALDARLSKPPTSSWASPSRIKFPMANCRWGGTRLARGEAVAGPSTVVQFPLGLRSQSAALRPVSRPGRMHPTHSTYIHPLIDVSTCLHRPIPTRRALGDDAAGPGCSRPWTTRRVPRALSDAETTSLCTSLHYTLTSIRVLECARPRAETNPAPYVRGIQPAAWHEISTAATTLDEVHNARR